ncbi:uncharacterized protein A4U43_C03F21840 [Asparagus officinalis]|uniref:Uncharacterized protein n=1 Tax=Asparagus officinalis TaxID=4686 RepID=A0A5P1FGA9_ASPOF|nr:uncharacterized protein A4U43_C03F21840 [Asparagus officinalis]
MVKRLEALRRLMRNLSKAQSSQAEAVDTLRNSWADEVESVEESSPQLRSSILNVDGGSSRSLRTDPILEPILNVVGSYLGKSDPDRTHRSIPGLSGIVVVTQASMAQVEINNVVHKEVKVQEVIGTSGVKILHNQGCSEVHQTNLDQAGSDTHCRGMEYVENYIVDTGAI